ncbi:MAG: hypothetical protein M0C28_40990 [Candidatus Moduliflexus flocculans]|nr:hypothetical protein [Candidatus Moduliflexus flocculans]
MLRLDRGPTASFKDFAARMMARCTGHCLVRERGGELLILTATSGDTGSRRRPRLPRASRTSGSWCCSPVDEVSDRQRKQMTTLGGNVATLGAGRQVRRLPGPGEAAPSPTRTSPASEPVLGQLDQHRPAAAAVGLLRATPASRLADVAGGEPVVFCVPSGNFGDMMGGLLARQHGPAGGAASWWRPTPTTRCPRFLATGALREDRPLARRASPTP